MAPRVSNSVGFSAGLGLTLACALLSACGHGSSPESGSSQGGQGNSARSAPAEPEEGLWVTFEVDGESFKAVVVDEVTISEILGGEGRDGKKTPTGKPVPGGDFNSPWQWHLVPSSVRLAEPGIAIPECVVKPSLLEKYFLPQCATYSPPAVIVSVRDCRTGRCVGV